jgi:hypothetical protein
MDNEAMLTTDDRAADARAARAIGWKSRISADHRGSPIGALRVFGVIYAWTDPSGVDRGIEGLPHFGSDPAAARALLEAVPEDKRAEVIYALFLRLGADVERAAKTVWYVSPDELYLLLLAPPAAIRDAVLEAVEGREE